MSYFGLVSGHRTDTRRPFTALGFGPTARYILSTSSSRSWLFVPRARSRAVLSSMNFRRLRTLVSQNRMSAYLHGVYCFKSSMCRPHAVHSPRSAVSVTSPAVAYLDPPPMPLPGSSGRQPWYLSFPPLSYRHSLHPHPSIIMFISMPHVSIYSLLTFHPTHARCTVVLCGLRTTAQSQAIGTTPHAAAHVCYDHRLLSGPLSVSLALYFTIVIARLAGFAHHQFGMQYRRYLAAASVHTDQRSMPS